MMAVGTVRAVGARARVPVVRAVVAKVEGMAIAEVAAVSRLVVLAGAALLDDAAPRREPCPTHRTVPQSPC